MDCLFCEDKGNVKLEMEDINSKIIELNISCPDCWRGEDQHNRDMEKMNESRSSDLASELASESSIVGR